MRISCGGMRSEERRSLDPMPLPTLREGLRCWMCVKGPLVSLTVGDVFFWCEKRLQMGRRGEDVYCTVQAAAGGNPARLCSWPRLVHLPRSRPTGGDVGRRRRIRDEIVATERLNAPRAKRIGGCRSPAPLMSWADTVQYTQVKCWSGGCPAGTRLRRQRRRHRR